CSCFIVVLSRCHLSSDVLADTTRGMTPDAPSTLDHHVLPCSGERALASLSEPVRAWFRQRFGDPTLAQRLAWPVVAAGKNLLLSAPTGSGKTIAAFLPVLDQL